MSGVLGSALAFVLAIGVLISVHEFGHFWVARRLGVKVLRFSIGFGRPLLSRKAGPDATEFVLAAIPLGGYVKMLDGREGPVPDAELHRSFDAQSLAVRSAIVVAGPLFNLVFAVLAYWALFVAGVDGLRPVIGAVAPETPAAVAGLRDGDEIVGVAGRDTPTWEAVTYVLMDALVSGDPVTVMVRDDAGRDASMAVDAGPDGHRLIEGGDLLGNLGITPWRPRIDPVIASVSPGAPAERAGLRAGDRIVAAGSDTIAEWRELVAFVQARPGATFPIVVERDGARLELSVTPRAIERGGRTIGLIGAGPEVPEDLFAGMRATHRLGPAAALGESLHKTWDMGLVMLTMLGKMVIGEASLQNINGPLSIAEYAGRTASIGLAPFLSFLAVISISLGVLNLLPIPLLDGGHLLYYLIELIKGSPVSETVEALGQRLGIGALLMLMGLAFYNDLARLFGG